jgi:hypothetical protein
MTRLLTLLRDAVTARGLARAYADLPATVRRDIGLTGVILDRWTVAGATDRPGKGNGGPRRGGRAAAPAMTARASIAT